jgi:hypothetical protein
MSFVTQVADVIKNNSYEMFLGVYCIRYLCNKHEYFGKIVGHARKCVGWQSKSLHFITLL